MENLTVEIGAVAPHLVALALNLLVAILILVVGWTVSSALGKVVKRAATHSRIDPTIVPMLRTTVVWTVRVFTLIAVLANFGIQTTSIIAVLGAAGLAVGLALQGTLQNIAAGIMLIALRPLRAGEAISAGGNIEGTVEEIGLFLTRLTQGDGIYLSVPNSTIWNAPIVNYSRNTMRRFDLAMLVRYGDDLDVALARLKGIVDNHPMILQTPAPQIMVTEYRDNGVVVTVRVWAENSRYWDLRFDLYYKARKALEDAGLRAPVPVREIQGAPPATASGAGAN